ncbi:uncharacterized protein [Macrobrachium rosenbergii]|uniref:uncharacterized protein n=1 Tax=Macrobrachium rosenbergii TaxID=79674 RepID=UPI0034D498A8
MREKSLCSNTLCRIGFDSLLAACLLDGDCDASSSSQKSINQSSSQILRGGSLMAKMVLYNMGVSTSVKKTTRGTSYDAVRPLSTFGNKVQAFGIQLISVIFNRSICKFFQ